MRLTKLTRRIECPNGYYDAEVNDKTYSVVDFGTTMKSHPKPEGLFLGWEAAQMVNGHFEYEHLIRADSWAELEKLL